MVDKHYTTSDTTLAAYLISGGYYLVGIDYNKPRFEFTFDDSNGLRQSVMEYISGHAVTEPVAYSRVTKKLLRLIRRQIQWEEDY